MSLTTLDPKVLCVDVDKLFGRQIVGVVSGLPVAPLGIVGFLEREGDLSKLTAKHTADRDARNTFLGY